MYDMCGFKVLKYKKMKPKEIGVLQKCKYN